MAPSPANMYADVLRHDLCAFIHRSFIELEAGKQFLWNWHIEVLAAKLEEVRRGCCKRLIVNMPPRHLKSDAISIAFPAWMLGHDPTKQLLSVTYAQDLSDNLARRSRTLMTSPFYQALFDTRISRGREAVSDYETTAGGYRLSTSISGVLTGRGADIIVIDDPLKADDALSRISPPLRKRVVRQHSAQPSQQSGKRSNYHCDAAPTCRRPRCARSGTRVLGCTVLPCHCRKG